MKSSSWSIALVLAALVAGYLVGSGSGERPASAQAQSPAAAGGRYQMHSWGAGVGHGCYVVDTVTGQLWYVSQQGPARKIADKLP